MWVSDFAHLFYIFVALKIVGLISKWFALSNIFGSGCACVAAL